MPHAIRKGTSAQIEWAIKLIETEVARIDKMLAPIPAKEDRNAIFQKLYGEEIAFVKAIRTALAKRIQSARWVIDNRNNLVYHASALLLKTDADLNARFPEDLVLRVVTQVNDGNWLKGTGF